MFSNLGSIFINPPRHAESADTRAEIKRHDPDQQKREQKEKDDEPNAFFDTDDTATISVPALAVFLDNFIQGQSPDSRAQAANIQISEGAATNMQPITRAGRAAGAYARADHLGQPPTIAPPATTGATLSAEDLRLMHTVRDGVQKLIARNIDILKIEKGESFLASLAASVEKALSG